MANVLKDIDVLLFDGFNLLDVAGPVQAFTDATADGKSAYRVRFVSVENHTVTASCGLSVNAQAIPKRARSRADLLVPGGEGVNEAVQRGNVRRFLRTFSPEYQNRMISVCSGALLLADAGLLDGRAATTHWAREQEAVARYPGVHWSLDQIYVRDGPVITSAGVTSGIDLALEIIREDLGSHEALAVARELVVSLKRSGGQSQYAELLESQLGDDNVVADLVSRLQRYPNRNWTLEMMAERVGSTPRTLSRKCTASTGLSPVKLLEKIRVKLAGDMLGEGQMAAQVVRKAGFSNEQSMQRGFKRHLGVTVGEYAKKFTAGNT